MNKIILVLLSLIGICLKTEGQSKQERLASFIQSSGALVSLNDATGLPEFIRFTQTAPAFFLPTGSSQQKSMAFSTAQRELLGFANPSEELIFQNKQLDHLGLEHLTYQQYYQDIPVFGGIVRFHFDAAQKLRAFNGVYIPDIKINVAPSISAQEAAEIALTHITQQFSNLSVPIQAEEAELYIFRKGLIEDKEGANHLVFKVTVTNTVGVREFVYVDAHNGLIVEQFTGHHGALFRRLYEQNTSNEIWTEGDDLPGDLDSWQQNELIAAEHCYHFFNHAFGFTSYDGSNAEMLTINNNPNIQCPNASWNGYSANYCTGTAADDVVAHEWGHAYTEHTSGLIYAWQSGALNESYSDIWGETIDLLNNYEDDGEDLSARNACASSHRWRMGEDASAFGGAIRDMWNPTCKGDPGKVTDVQYHCSTSDNGGVHTNSGVNNHAYALLVDGGSYNGQTITGLGFTKAAHIFWRAQRHYLTPTSDFAVQADALEAACNDLMGTNLTGLSTTSTAPGPSGEIIDANDLLELQKVLMAVEMRTSPGCLFSAILDPAPALCPAALPDSAIFFEDFESGLGLWTTSEVPENPDTWEERSWQIAADLPDLRPGTGVFGTDPVNGDCQEDLENGVITLESPDIVMPTQVEGVLELAFDHYLSTEFLWDGGHVHYQINHGAWAQVPAASFEINGYNASLKNAVQGNDNPMAGKEAFTGSDGGSVAGSWGRSVINLSGLGVQPSDNLKIKWEVSTDGCNGRIGWYLDDIRVYDCGPCLDSLQLSSNRNGEEILFKAASSIKSTELISGQADISYSAGSDLELMAGFSIEMGSEMHILMEGCTLANLAAKPGSTSLSGNGFEIENFAGENRIDIKFNDLISKNMLILIYNRYGQLIGEFKRQDQDIKRNKKNIIEINNLSQGIYSGQVIIDKKISNFNFSVR